MIALRFFHSLSSAHFDRVCQFLLLFVLGSVLQRSYWRDSADPFKCNGLLNEGHWLGSGTSNDSSTFRDWQPAGCMMHKYNKRDIEQCLSGQKLVIVGDSTSRQLFEATIEKLGHKLKDLEGHGKNIKHGDMELQSGTTTVQFIWDPYLNSTGLDQQLKNFRYEPSPKNESNPSTGLLFLRAPGLWHARNDGENYLKYYKKNVDRLIPYTKPQYLQQLGGRQEPSNLMLMSPMLVPYYEALSDVRKASITPERVDQMSDYLKHVSSHGELPVVWSFSSMLAGASSRGTHDMYGLHLVSNVAHAEVDILLNLRCNAKVATRGYPYDRTCCMSYQRPDGIQWLVLLCGIFALLFMAWNWSSSLLSSMPVSTVVENFKAAPTLLLVLCFCFLADRTHIFEVGQKHFSGIEFAISCLAATVLGLFSLRPIKKSSKLSGPVDDMFLSRDQTDEWKGWMQALILLYHYLGASQSLGTYKVIRLLVSSYLFMTGYGHTLSLLQHADFSFKKVSAVVLRLNILTVALAYVMETNYLFYYFPALSTFWYLVIYLVLRVGHTHNSNVAFLTCKILLSALITTAFIRIPVFMDIISSCLQFLFNINWDIPEWRFRLTLDLYIVYVGMMAALLRHHSQQRQNQGLEVDAERYHVSILHRLQECISHPGKITLVVTTMLSVAFFLVARTFPSKPTYNHLLPYISWAPIVGFVALRNCHDVVKSYHSVAFAWLGRISLETYILQYHIWLAGDTKGILRMGLFNRGIEAAILTPLFIWLSWRTSEATRFVVRQLIEVKQTEVTYNMELEEDHALMSPDGIEDPDEKVLDNSRTSIASKLWKVITLYCNKILGDLRWRMLAVGALLWLANVVSSRPVLSESSKSPT